MIPEPSGSISIIHAANASGPILVPNIPTPTNMYAEFTHKIRLWKMGISLYIYYSSE